MRVNQQLPADLLIFAKKFLYGELHFFLSEGSTCFEAKFSFFVFSLRDYQNSLVIRQKGESQNGGNKKIKLRQIFQTTNISYSRIRE